LNDTGTVRWNEKTQDWDVTEDTPVFKGLTFPRTPPRSDRAPVLGQVDGRGRYAESSLGDQRGTATAGIEISPRERIESRVQARQDETGQSLKNIVVDYASNGGEPPPLPYPYRKLAKAAASEYSHDLGAPLHTAVLRH